MRMFDIAQGALMAGLAGGCFQAGVASSTDRPNIVFILADDLGYGDISCNGQELYKTPNIDRLAAEGMMFSQSYSGSSVCAPSRCALMTGLDMGHAPIRGNVPYGDEGQVPMPADTFTVAKLLKESGYTTGIFGKWGLGYPGSGSEPFDMGFDHFYGYNCQRMAHNYFPYFLWNDHQREILWGNFGLQQEEYSADLIHQKALMFIRENKDRPFFCYYAATLPHAEMFAPEKYMKQYRGKFLPEVSYSGTDSGLDFRKGAYGSQSEAHAAHAAMIRCLDDYVGQVMAELKEQEIDDKTLVVFSSDNGPHDEGGNDPDYFHSAGSFRGIKRDLYEGGIRVPFIARWSGRIAAGSQSDHPIAFWDFLPTMADLVGQPAPTNTDGISFLPTLQGQPGQREHEYLYWEFHGRGGRVAIRKGNWKGIRYHVDAAPDSPLELYDLSVDSSEKHNVAAQHPEVVLELTRLIQQSRRPHPVPQFNFLVGSVVEKAATER
jgi:arylsulfatase A-like enzyme